MVNLLQNFPAAFLHYLWVIAPGMAAGFLASGLIHEFAPDFWINQSLRRGGLKSILFISISGALLPLCSWAELPLAVSFYRKGVKIGPVLAFLLTAPATSIVSLFLAYKMLGPVYTSYIFCAVIIMGVTVGVIGNLLTRKPSIHEDQDPDSIEKAQEHFKEFFKLRSHKKDLPGRMASALRYGFIELPQEIGPGIIIGVAIAALTQNSLPLQDWLRQNLGGAGGYVVALGLSATLINTSYTSVFIANALLAQGLSSGAAMFFLLLSPVLSYGTILVLKKELGLKVLSVYAGLTCGLSLLLGYLFSLLGL